MKVLVACEESQEVTKAFRARGHEAYSCDLLPCSGGHPEWHIRQDAIKVLWSNKWDLVIAHPPCTRLANSGVRWLSSKRERERVMFGAIGLKFILEMILKYGMIFTTGLSF